MRRALLLVGLLIAGLIVEPIVSPANAQDSGPSADKPAKNKRAKRAKRGKRARDAAAKAPETAKAKPATDRAVKGEAAVPQPESAAAADRAAAPSAAFGAEEQVRKEGDTEVKTVEFTGLDIEGQLKTPQLLYFLTRLRAEFDRPRLPHRSFMPELQRTPGEKSLR
jgi:hypothetical protein